jgi:hypothetical protein
MGFNKRYLNKEILLSNIEKIDLLLNVDALVMDSWASNFIKDINKNQRRIRKELINDIGYDLSMKYINHRNFYLLNSLSEAIINLKTNPNWVDIHIVWIKTGFKLDEQGNFDILSKRALEYAISYYDRIS